MITLLWLFSCPVMSFFLLHTPNSNRAADIHALWLKWRGSDQGQSFWGLGRWVTFWGEIYPNPLPKKGVWICVFKPKSQNAKTYIYCIDSNQILHSDKDHQTPSCVVQSLTQQIQDGGRNLARWRSFVLALVQTEIPVTSGKSNLKGR